MNLLGLVFAIIMILSFGFYTCLDKQVSSYQLRKTYSSQNHANRKILNSYQSEVYKNCKGEAVKKSEEKNPTQQTPKGKRIGLNRGCSKINLWPLIQDGREAHPVLYDLAKKLLSTFYAQLYSEDQKFDTHFLDLLLSSAKAALPENGPLALEKIDLHRKDMQKIYYRMLKGTKKWDLSTRKGFPPLVDYFKIEQGESKICLYHAHPDMLTVLFNEKAAQILHEEMHKSEGPAITKELVEKVCSEGRIFHPNEDLIALLLFGRPRHQEQGRTFIAEEDGVTIRKNLYIGTIKSS